MTRSLSLHDVIRVAEWALGIAAVVGAIAVAWVAIAVYCNREG